MKFIIKLFTYRRDISKSNFKTIWKLFSEEIINAEFFNAIEPINKKYSKNKYGIGFQILQEDINLLIKKEKQFLGIIYRIPGNIVCWEFELNISQPEDVFFNSIQLWLKSFNNEIPIVYGFGSTEKEYNNKHLEVIQSETGITSIGSIGDSQWDFYEFLPGIYWLNIFGKDLTRILGQSKILNLPDVTYFEKDNHVWFTLKDEAYPINSKKRKKIEDKIIKTIGSKHFFDRKNDILKFEHPSEFKEILENIR